MSTTGPATRRPSITGLHLDRVLPPLREVLAALPDDLRRGAGQLTRRSSARLLADPPLPLLAVLRRLPGPVRLPARGVRLTLLTRHRDVTGALADDDAFRITPYVKPMHRLAGPFALAMDGAEHAAARHRLDGAVACIDLEALGPWADRVAVDLLRQARPDGRLDVVTELAGPLAVAFVADHLGVGRSDPASDADASPGRPAEPDGLTPQAQMAVWTTAFFEDCFLNAAADRGVRRRAGAAATGLRHLTREAVEAARQRGEDGPPRTVLAGLLAQCPDDPERVVVDLVGIAVGAVPTVTEAVVRVVDHLLDHPEAAKAVATAARGGDRAEIWRHVRECLRFSPQSPALLRTCRSDSDTKPAPVVAYTLSAMHDRDAVAEPGRYRIDRPDETYLHFGVGPHRCLGEPFARELLVAAVAALFREPRLARAAGTPGRLTFSGPAPARLVVELGPGRPR